MADGTHASGWTADQMPSQRGRRVIITGANSGIGWHPALELVRKSAEVVIPARSVAKGGVAGHDALPTLFAATSESAQRGGYYGPAQMFEYKEHPTDAVVPSTARDAAIASRL